MTSPSDSASHTTAHGGLGAIKQYMLKVKTTTPIGLVEWINAAGEYTDADGTSRRVAVSLGPEHGTVGQFLRLSSSDRPRLRARSGGFRTPIPIVSVHPFREFPYTGGPSRWRELRGTGILP